MRWILMAATGVMLWAGAAWADDSCLKLTDPVLQRECITKREARSATPFSPSTNTRSIANASDGEKLMYAASIVLAFATGQYGDITIDSENTAHSDNDIWHFEKIGECIYSQYGQNKNNQKMYMKIDFKKLTGDYHFHTIYGMSDLVIEGNSSKTFCFRNNSESGCLRDMPFFIDKPNYQRLLDNLSYILKTSCPEDAADPY